MALHPRMTRPGLRIALEALEAHLDNLTGEGKQVAQDVIRELRHQLESANADNRRRSAVKHGDADQAPPHSRAIADASTNRAMPLLIPADTRVTPLPERTG